MVGNPADCGEAMNRRIANSVDVRRNVCLLWNVKSDVSAAAIERLIRSGGVHDLAGNHRQYRLDSSNLIDGDAQIVLRQHGKIGEFPDLEGTARAPIAWSG